MFAKNLRCILSGWGRRWFECMVRLELQFLASSLGTSLISDYFMIIPGRSIELMKCSISVTVDFHPDTRHQQYPLLLTPLTDDGVADTRH